MSLKMMKKTLLVSAIVAMGSVAAIGCGDSSSDGDKDSGSTGGDKDAGGGGGEDDAGAGPATQSRGGTLVAITAADTSAPLLGGSKITVVNALTGEPLTPALTATTSAKDGTWKIDNIPTGTPYAFHVEGTGDDKTGTYDSIIGPVKATTPDDPLTRISSASTAAVAGATGGFTANQEMSALSGGIYVVRDGKRVGAIGCAKVYIDDEPHPAEKYDQRYINDNSLPTTLDKQQATLPNRGTFFFGNLATGMHKMKVTVDDGKTFFGETEIFVKLARKDAVSNYKAVLYQVGIDILDGDKTPASCK
jgi:hypothetical protein